MPDKGDYAAEHRVPYGTDITIPEGPAKGFVIDETITGPHAATADRTRTARPPTKGAPGRPRATGLRAQPMCG